MEVANLNELGQEFKCGFVLLYGADPDVKAQAGIGRYFKLTGISVAKT
jgi:hypothetical protein